MGNTIYIPSANATRGLDTGERENLEAVERADGKLLTAPTLGEILQTNGRKLLGVSSGVVALTKSDLVDPDVLGLVRLEIEEFVRGSFLEGAPVVPVSATTGAGLDAFKKELLRVAETVPAKDATQHFRLPIDRAFSMKGFGTVVTGTLVSGSLQAEDEAELYPLRKRVRVRGLHSGGRAVSRAMAGQRTADGLSPVLAQAPGPGGELTCHAGRGRAAQQW